MTDYDRFLKGARGHADHLARIATRLLGEGRITRATYDALTSTTQHLLQDAYMAGRCEPEGVRDIEDEFARIGGGQDGGAVDPCPGCGALPGEACEPDCPDLADLKAMLERAGGGA